LILKAPGFKLKVKFRKPISFEGRTFESHLPMGRETRMMKYEEKDGLGSRGLMD